VGSFRFEGQPVRIGDGDTVASALYRHGVRTFTRSLKYHRRRGLYCMSGDCPNCLVSVDGEPGIRACRCEAVEGMHVERESGFPSPEHDLLAIMDRLHRLTPVGFYYKVFGRPPWLWPLAERVIRRATGLGSLPVGPPASLRPARHVRADVLVIGAGLAGLAATEAAAGAGARILVVDEGRPGETIAPGPIRDRVQELAARVRELPGVELLERHAAIGLYEGPMVPVSGPDALLEIEPERIVVATGATESHVVFPGNDLPGVWLGRGAARMAGVHGIRPGARAVVLAETEESVGHLHALRAAGVELVEVLASRNVAALVPSEMRVTVEAGIVRAEGRRHLSAVVVRIADRERRIPCDALVMSAGLTPRDGLPRMVSEMPLAWAGDVAYPGCSPDEAVRAGILAGRATAAITVTPTGEAGVHAPAGGGTVCLCEDVGVDELAQAWREGFTNAETLKRYTTATMGPCQGAMCGRHLAAFVRSRSAGRDAVDGTASAASARTTARPPVRAVKLEDLAGGVDEVIENRTSLHDVHLAMGATVGRSGSWMRPYRYGDPHEEYLAVRERVSVMDVGTLGKFLIGGPDARVMLDRTLPCRIEDLGPGRSRYFLALDEAGYVMDDGLVCALGDDRYVLTSTSGGADRMEAWLRDRIDRLGLTVHVMNRTSTLGTINVAGPRARDLLVRLSDDPVDAAALPVRSHREITVAGVRCRAIRAGFVGELSFELHHPRSRGPELWKAFLRDGDDLGIAPHGLDALDVLRLEKGHPYLGQDTLPDDHPHKLGLGWTVAVEKSDFVGKVALQRMAELPLERKLVGLRFDAATKRGAPLQLGSHIVGRVTSSASSHVLGYPIGLGWVRSTDGVFPTELRAGGGVAVVVPTPFYDPQGARLRD
jgi:sarcosine oxidase subunit alpha